MALTTSSDRPNPFRSARLLYRAPEPDSPTDQDLFYRIQTDPTDFANSNARLLKPQSKKDAQDFLKNIAEDRLLGVVICLPADKSANVHDIPIGVLSISASSPRMPQHAFNDLGIDIVSEHQGKGYGSEAIIWSLGWAFDHARLHRVGIRAFGWNTGARRLYERLGFVPEGVVRQQLWHNGRWWDDYGFGMLEDEWRERKKRKENAE